MTYRVRDKRINPRKPESRHIWINSSYVTTHRVRDTHKTQKAPSYTTYECVRHMQWRIEFVRRVWISGIPIHMNEPAWYLTFERLIEFVSLTWISESPESCHIRTNTWHLNDSSSSWHTYESRKAPSHATYEWACDIWTTHRVRDTHVNLGKPRVMPHTNELVICWQLRGKLRLKRGAYRSLFVII